MRYRGKIIKGVLERPWTKRRVLRAFSSTLNFQFTVKCWKVDFLMPCKTRSCQSSTEKLRSSRTPLDLTNFNMNYQKTIFCVKLDFTRFANKCLDLLFPFVSYHAIVYKVSPPRRVTDVLAICIVFFCVISCIMQWTPITRNAQFRGQKRINRGNKLKTLGKKWTNESSRNLT